MINPVSLQEMKSTPASTPAVSTPLKNVSFKGEPEEDTVEIKGETKEAEKPKKLSAEDIRKKSEEFSESVDAFADNIDKTTDSVTNAATKTTGAVTLIGGAFAKLIPAPIKDFFATPQYIEKVVKDEAGNILKDENGKDVIERILKTKKGSDGVERVVRTWNKKNTAIAAGVLAAIALTTAIVKVVKNKAKQAEKAQKA